MTWLYKTKGKVAGTKDIAEVLPVCPKCHYNLLIRNGERALYCPMCGTKHLELEEAVKNGVAKKTNRKAKTS